MYITLEFVRYYFIAGWCLVPVALLHAHVMDHSAPLEGRQKIDHRPSWLSVVCVTVILWPAFLLMLILEGTRALYNWKGPPRVR